MIEIYNVKQQYSENQIALKDINLFIPKGEMVFFVGESGAGKSTLTKLLYKAASLTSGMIKIGKIDISKLTDHSQLRRRIGLIFQDTLLLPHLNIFDNVAYPLRALGASPREIVYRVEGALNVVGLLDRARDLPSTLSGGEKQRIGIARSIVTNPPILIADEPTGNLDAINSMKIFQLFKEINEKLGMTIIVVTHDPRVHELNKRIIQLADGYIIQDTQPQPLPTQSNHT